MVESVREEPGREKPVGGRSLGWRSVGEGAWEGGSVCFYLDEVTVVSPDSAWRNALSDCHNFNLFSYVACTHVVMCSC